MKIKKEDIAIYLTETKEAIANNRYRMERNTKRPGNIELFLDYVINESRAKEILFSLAVTDFSGILQNEHKRFGHERLYVFGKDVKLLERNGAGEKVVPLYIKLNKLDSCFVVVVSFHEQKYPLAYYFGPSVGK